MDYFYNESYSLKKISEDLKMHDSTVNSVITGLKNVNIIKETTWIQ